MSIHFLHPTDRLQIAEQADAIALEAEAMRDLAAALGRFEEATGRKVFVSDGLFATEGAEARWLADSGAGVYYSAMPAEMTGVVIESAAQVAGDGSGKALPPIEEGSATTLRVAEASQTARKVPAVPTAGRASYANGKPKAVLKAKGENRPWGKLTLPEREIVKHLERLPDTFAPQDDLRLVELLTGGNKIDVAAAFLEVEPADALARWKSFLTEDVIGADGKPTLDGQARLINALRYRVEDGDA